MAGTVNTNTVNQQSQQVTSKQTKSGGTQVDTKIATAPVQENANQDVINLSGQVKQSSLLGDKKTQVNSQVGLQGSAKNYDIQYQNDSASAYQVVSPDGTRSSVSHSDQGTSITQWGNDGQQLGTKTYAADGKLSESTFAQDQAQLNPVQIDSKDPKVVTSGNSRVGLSQDYTPERYNIETNNPDGSRYTIENKQSGDQSHVVTGDRGTRIIQTDAQGNQSTRAFRADGTERDTDLTKTANVVDAAGKGVSDLGSTINGIGGGLQKGINWLVDGAVGINDKVTDKLKDTALGQNDLVKGALDAQNSLVHFQGGAVKGLTSVGTGLVSAAGLGVQALGEGTRFVSNQEHRDHTLDQVDDARESFRKDPLAVPKAIGDQIGKAWKEDPADLLGQTAGVIAGTVLTAGTGSASKATTGQKLLPGSQKLIGGAADDVGRQTSNFADDAYNAGNRATQTATQSADDAFGFGQYTNADDLKAAYRKDAKKYHPDTNGSTPEATEAFKQYQDAYNQAKAKFE